MELDPNVRPSPDFGLSSDSIVFSGSGRSIAAAKTDGTSGASTLLSTSRVEQDDELSRQQLTIQRFVDELNVEHCCRD